MLSRQIQSTQHCDEFQVSFGWRKHEKLQTYASTPERELFYYLINADAYLDVFPRARQVVTHSLSLAQVARRTSGALPERLQGFTYTPEALASRLEALYRHQYTAQQYTVTTPDRAPLLYELRQYAPTALVDGCWLQHASQAAACHTDIAARLFAIYTEKIGDGETSRHYGNMYQDLLHSAEMYFPEVTSRAFTTQSDLVETAFTNPVFQLSLSLFPRVYLPEILGFTLGHFFHRPDGFWCTLAAALPRYGLDGRYYQCYALADKPGKAACLAQEAVTLYLDGIVDEDKRQHYWQRLWTGVVVHTVITQGWWHDMQTYLAAPRAMSPRDKMLAMLRHKAPYAQNFHRDKKLGKMRLNERFAAEPFDAEGLLEALAASPYIDREDPAHSPFLTHLIRFGGPMFRIFTAEEQATIVEWIHSLSSDPQPQACASSTANPPPPSPPTHASTASDYWAQDLKKYARCSKRELYHYLVNVDLYPDVLSKAHDIALQYFRRAKATMRKWSLPKHLRFFPYSHNAFEERVRAMYDTQTSAYKEFVPPAKVPKDGLIWFMKQYAPSSMVDGCWLQNMAKVGTSHTEIAARLFRIYADELGNANPTHNHPNVYRRFLESVHIDMPPTDSFAFVQQPEIRETAFDVPLLLLSVSMFPKTFLPEIIGVNLAIELNGLGRDYMVMIDDLTYWKLDPYYFALHLTIDNMASGHTAVSIETVELYLDQVLATNGKEAVQREWERIWTGYLAFDRTQQRFTNSLLWQVALRFVVPQMWCNLWRNIRKTAPTADVS